MEVTNLAWRNRTLLFERSGTLAHLAGQTLCRLKEIAVLFFWKSLTFERFGVNEARARLIGEDRF